MTWFTKSVVDWWRRYTGRRWNDMVARWDDSVATWDDLQGDGWYEQNQASWYTKN